MRHGVKKAKLGRDSSHRKAMLRNLAISILKQGSADEQAERPVKTTIQKAKAVRSMVERLITYAKKGDLSARRQAAKLINNSKSGEGAETKKVLQSLFSEIGPRYQERQGGYTRILKLSANRHGDNAEMALISLVEDDAVAAAAPAPAESAAAE
jgi:large subunit ribosomal protein L17